MTGFPGNARPSSSAVRSDSGGAFSEPAAAQCGHCQSGAGVEHQRHWGMAELPVAPARASGPLAGPAARRLPAGLTHQRRRVAGPGHLDQDRPALQAVLGGPPGGAGKPRHQGQRVAFLFKTVRGVQDARNRPADQRPLRLDGHGPASLHQPLQFRAAVCAGHQAGRALLVRAQQQYFAGVGVRGPLLDVEVVAVVPAGHKAQVPRRGERCGPGADGHAARFRPGAAGNSGSGVSGRHRRSGGRCRRRAAASGRLLEPVQVAVVRHHHHGAAAGGADGGHGLGDQCGQPPGP